MSHGLNLYQQIAPFFQQEGRQWRPFIIRPIPSPLMKPLLVFVNPKSGGNQVIMNQSRSILQYLKAFFKGCWDNNVVVNRSNPVNFANIFTLYSGMTHILGLFPLLNIHTQQRPLPLQSWKLKPDNTDRILADEHSSTHWNWQKG